MPCQSEYLAPHGNEIEGKRVCQLIVYAAPLAAVIVPHWADKAAKDAYGLTGVGMTEQRHLDAATEILCDICNALPDAIMYDGRERMRRRLADWWDRHKEADRKREGDHQEHQRQQKLAQQAEAKLTPQELEAITKKARGW